METTTIRKQLHNYLDTANEKKLKAIYTMVEEEIAANTITYTAADKAEFDIRVNHYLNGGKMVSAAEMNKRIRAARKKGK
jgi:hypothetical protein